MTKKKIKTPAVNISLVDKRKSNGNGNNNGNGKSISLQFIYEEISHLAEKVDTGFTNVNEKVTKLTGSFENVEKLGKKHESVLYGDPENIKENQGLISYVQNFITSFTASLNAIKFVYAPIWGGIVTLLSLYLMYKLGLK
jgi:hypothetical protein